MRRKTLRIIESGTNPPIECNSILWEKDKIIKKYINGEWKDFLKPVDGERSEGKWDALKRRIDSIESTIPSTYYSPGDIIAVKTVYEGMSRPLEVDGIYYLDRYPIKSDEGCHGILVDPTSGFFDYVSEWRTTSLGEGAGTVYVVFPLLSASREMMYGKKAVTRAGYTPLTKEQLYKELDTLYG